MSQSQKRVLIVDDEPMIREIAFRAFTAAGLVCEAAEDGAIAAGKFAQQPFDAVVTDLRMPNRNGHSLAAELVRHPTRPVIIVITAVTEPRLASDLKHRGVAHIAFKPIDHVELAQRIVELLNVMSPQSEKSLAAPFVDGQEIDSEGAAVEAGLTSLNPNNVDLYFHCTSFEHSSDDIAWFVKQNPRLSDRVVTQAQASIRNSSSLIGSVRDAVVRLGQRHIGELALETGE
tara:strand:- start:5910 stop:6602 length:693 start_codon:yes stop_codon:yes gene_type:complete